MKSIRTLLVFVAVIAAIAAFQLFRAGPAPMPAMFEPTLDLAAAQLRALAESRPILALVTADWCSYCQQLKRGGLSDPRVGELALARTIPAYIDATSRSSPGGQAAARLAVSGMPTLLILAPDGQEIDRLVGNQRAEAILTFIEQSTTPRPELTPAG